MSVQAIAWSPTGAVRIVDQRALPEARIERDLESAEAVAEAIRTLQVRGAPLIGIAAAMGLVAGTRELRSASRQEFVGRLGRLAELLAAARPTAVNLRWALERMTRRATATPGDGVALWERLLDLTDPESLLPRVGPRIRGIATGGRIGAPRHVVDALPALEIIAINGIGTDAVDLGNARRTRGAGCAR